MDREIPSLLLTGAPAAPLVLAATDDSAPRSQAEKQHCFIMSGTSVFARNCRGTKSASGSACESDA
jgi:hypothetical protein